MSDALTPADIEALMDTVSGGLAGEGSMDESVIAYSFKRPNRVSQEQIRSLHSLHESLARNLEFSFSTLLRQITDISIVSVMQLTYEEFLQSLPSPACLCLFADKELKSNIALEVGLDTVFPMIDRLLGGKGGKATIRRELTELEWTILRPVVDAFLDEYSKMWRPVRDLSFKVRANESNPHQVQLVGPNEVVVLIVMKIEVGELNGMMTVCFPFVALEPLVQRLNLRNWLATDLREARDEGASPMRMHLGRFPMRIGAYLGGTRIPMRSLIGLKAGDVLRLDVSLDDEIAVVVNGVRKLAGRPVSHAGTKAVRITRPGAADSESHP
jgi:flagellar motor switch protein FliM